jgi:hypothetical protein
MGENSMSKGLRISLIVVGAVLAAGVLVLAGFALARTAWGVAGGWPAGMMGRYFGDPAGAASYAYGGGMGPGMMGYYQPDASGEGAYPGIGGMMSGGMMGGGMMGGTNLYGLEPLTLAQAEAALADYLAALGDETLKLGEIMIFDNHAYAQIVEVSTGIGAMEVLVDPVSGNVYPEHGPNMMWNLKYSPMAGFGMMGGMMGQFGSRSPGFGLGRLDPSAEMVVTAPEAVEAAQNYLDLYLPGTEAGEHADPFYGYYTLHILRDGETVGMLSVNWYSAQVFLHSWHGDFVEMTEEE